MGQAPIGCALANIKIPALKFQSCCTGPDDRARIARRNETVRGGAWNDDRRANRRRHRGHVHGRGLSLQRRHVEIRQAPDHPQRRKPGRVAVDRTAWRATGALSPRRHRPLRPWHHGRHQRRAGAQGRPHRPHHHRGLPRRAGDRAADAPPDVSASILDPRRRSSWRRAAAQGSARARSPPATVLTPLDEAARAQRVADELVAEGVEAIAIVLPVLLPQSRA